MKIKRQAILEAIQYGFNTPSAIGKVLGQPPKMVAKTLYSTKKDNEIEPIGHGKYQIATGYVEVVVRLPIKLNNRLKALKITDRNALYKAIKIGIDKLERTVRFY